MKELDYKELFIDRGGNTVYEVSHIVNSKRVVLGRLRLPPDPRIEELQQRLRELEE